MTLVVDGVFFQLAQSGIARVWRAALPRMVEKIQHQIILLDRGGVGPIEGIEIVPFPTYKQKYNAHDSALLQKICDHYSADAFISTYYTTPLYTPSLSVVYDMIPERLGFELDARDWQEKELAIAHARSHICISESTRTDLLSFYPELDPDKVTVGYCGVDSSVFSPKSEAEIASVRYKLGLQRPYFIFVGSRRQHKSYKNSRLFFDSVAKLQLVDFDVLCVGGEPLDAAELAGENGLRMVHANLEDYELAAAYGGAAALVYPSLYEGFGLPVVEAMSCGCPVISTNHGSLAEVAADFVLKVDGYSVSEMTEALMIVRNPDVRHRLRAAAFAHAAKFRWEYFVDELALRVSEICRRSREGHYRSFYEQWTSLRTIQGEVDTLI